MSLVAERTRQVEAMIKSTMAGSAAAQLDMGASHRSSVAGTDGTGAGTGDLSWDEMVSTFDDYEDPLEKEFRKMEEEKRRKERD